MERLKKKLQSTTTTLRVYADRDDVIRNSKKQTNFLIFAGIILYYNNIRDRDE